MRASSPILRPAHLTHLAVVFSNSPDAQNIPNRAGHRIPGLFGRKFPFIVKQRNADGARVTEDTIETSTENSLNTKETREFRFAADPTSRSVVVRVRRQIGDTDYPPDREDHGAMRPTEPF